MDIKQLSEEMHRFVASKGWYDVDSTNQVFHVAVARGLVRQSDPLDVNETLGLQWFTPDEVRSLIVRNVIPDGLSLTALCWGLIAGASV